MSDRDIMLVPISIKGMLDIDSDNYKLDMLAAVYNTIDLGRDKIFPGAFIKSLQDKGNTRSILWQHQIGEPVGKGFFTDTTKGLACQALLPKSDTLVSGRVIPQINIGSVQGASIGYNTIQADFDDLHKCRNLKTLDLFETSLVTIPMHPGAQILSVTKAANNMGVCEYKGMDKQLKNYIYTLMEGLEDKQVISLLPTLADTVEWDEKKAIKDIKDHNGVAECYLGEIPIAYYDGEFKAVPKGIHCAIARLIGENIEIETKSRIEKYYSKFGKDSPFKETGKSLIDADIVKWMSRKQIAGILEGQEGIELTKGSRDYLVSCFKGYEVTPGGKEPETSAATEFFTTLKQFNAQI